MDKDSNAGGLNGGGVPEKLPTQNSNTYLTGLLTSEPEDTAEPQLNPNTVTNTYNSRSLNAGRMLNADHNRPRPATTDLDPSKSFDGGPDFQMEMVLFPSEPGVFR